MKRLLILFLTCVMIMGSVPATVHAQQSAGAIVFSQAELDQLLAPIALYPDPLLSQVLMAATYPLEVVQAARFSQQNPSLRGDALAQAVEGQPWDPSIKSLVEFPSVLAMMDDQLGWTQKLGDAFLAQQDAVMDTVQSLRAKAQAAGTLQSNQHQSVMMQDGAIDIEPAAPDVVYVPYYNPAVVYGGWWWPDYPPMVWAPPAGYWWSPTYGNVIATGIAFGVGVALIDSIFFDARPEWREHHFLVNRRDVGNRPRGAPVIWTHSPEHRVGVTYRDVPTRNRFQPPPNGNVNRDAYRGHVAVPSASAAHPAPAIRQPIEPTHPFMPTGPASVVQSHAERGRASRESGFNRAGAAHQQQRR